MGTVTFRTPPDLLAKFDEIARGRGGRSRFLRSMMEAVTKQGDGSGIVASPQTTRGEGRKVTIRLTAEEAEQLDREAARAGMRRTEWLSALASRRLTGKPQFGREDRDALRQAQRELRRIGVNLNQVTRALNVAVMPGQVLDVELAEVKEVERSVRAALVGVRRAVEGDLSYWSDEA